MAKTIKPTVRSIDMRTARPMVKRADPELLTPEHRAWRAQVLHRAGYRCEWIDGGQRCTTAAPERLIADHVVERKDGGPALDPANGQCLCVRHNTLKGLRARAERMKERY